MDVLVLETLNGGDVLVRGNDLVAAQGFDNMPYLALFGGNLAASTPSTRVQGEFNNDYWGNFLVLNRAAQANSDTERKIQNEPVTSAGRIRMEGTVRNDLRFMQQFAEVSATVSIISDDVIGISIRVQEPSNVQAKEFQFIWDGTRLSLGGGEPIYLPPPPVVEIAERLLENGAFRLLENGGRRLLE